MDGRESKQYDERVSSPVFSPDDRRLAYTVVLGGDESGPGFAFVVVDGAEGRRYFNIGSLVFSPDSLRTVYAAERLVMNNWTSHHVVFDGGEAEQAGRIEKQSFAFSPDSRQLAYILRTRLGPVVKWFAVVGDEAQKHYDGVSSLIFSPDSHHLAFIALGFASNMGLFKVGRTALVVVNGVDGGRYDDVVAPPGRGGIVFDSPDDLHYIARKDRAFYLVKERLT